MKNQVWILGWLLFGTVPSTFAGQPMAGMEIQEKTSQASHQGMGKVVFVDKAEFTVKLEHEAIKSLNWPGMTMNFSVANASLLEGIKAGDAVRFELRQSKLKEWVIVKIERKRSND